MTADSFKGLVLAAGRGSRFVDESGPQLPKVLRPALGKPIICYVLKALTDAGISDITLIVGFRADDVKNALGDSVGYVYQSEQKGSGHAAACAKDAYAGFDGHLVVMCGDSPLFSSQTVLEMMHTHIQEKAAVTLAAAVLDDPFGYGRIVRDSSGRITGIAEEKCATEEQKKIREVNGGAYCFDSGWLFENINLMELNEAGEYNLTDMVRVAIDQGRVVSAIECDIIELMGVNTPEQLKAVEEKLKTM